jgi:hypothetical protein
MAGQVTLKKVLGLFSNLKLSEKFPTFVGNALLQQ